MSMEYVPKSELKALKNEFNKAISFVRENIDTYSFGYRLIGSAKRNLVLRHHNKGIDLDYQIVFNKSIKNKTPKEYKEIKDKFRHLFDSYFVSKGYKNAEDSMSALTIKKTNTDKIENGYDITFISPEKDGLYILRYDTDEKKELTLKQMSNSYTFMKRYKEIKGNDMWKQLREIYKSKKKLNNGHKKSFALLSEAVKEVIDKYEKIIK